MGYPHEARDRFAVAGRRGLVAGDTSGDLQAGTSAAEVSSALRLWRQWCGDRRQLRAKFRVARRALHARPAVGLWRRIAAERVRVRFAAILVHARIRRLRLQDGVRTWHGRVSEKD